MTFPLVLLHVPALLAYVLSEHAVKDLFPRRQNACIVLEEFTKLAKGQGDPECLHKAVEKCKGVVKDPFALTTKTLSSLHDALSKNTPPLTRPVDDLEDTCAIEEWTAERSIVREMFGIQMECDGVVRHQLALDLEVTGNSLTKCLRDYIGNATVKRAPLILVCGFKTTKKMVDYLYDIEFAGIKYTLCAVATPEKAFFDTNGVWNVPLNSVLMRHASVVVYRRSLVTPSADG